MTRDFSLYHDLVRYLKDRGIPFTSLAFHEVPSPQIGVVLTSWRDVVLGDLPESLPVAVVPPSKDGDDLEAGVESALRILRGTERFRELFIGIDPGHRPGLAVVGDLRVVHRAHAMSPEEVTILVERALTHFQSDRPVVRIGNGSPPERDEILRRLVQRLEDVRIEIVDEHGTTPPTGTTGGLHPDVVAAERIARTPGHVARRPSPNDAPSRAPKRRNRPGSR